MRNPEAQARKDICELGRRMWQRGFCAGNEGNLSVRLGADLVLCTPTGVSKGFMRPEMMAVVDMEGKQVAAPAGKRATSEIRLHLAIYRKRADVGAVIHSHTPHATAFACAAEANRAGALPMGVHPEAEVFLGRVPVVSYCTPGTEAVGEGCCAAIDWRTLESRCNQSSGATAWPTRRIRSRRPVSSMRTRDRWPRLSTLTSSGPTGL